ncbi:DUF6543 domain-containing protein [Pseudomonas sp. SIMBA_077]
MLTPTLPASSLQLAPSPVQQAVYKHFADRPRIDELIRTTLMAALKERYPTLTVDLSSTRLAIPLEGGGWGLPLFIDRVLAYLAEGAPFEISHLSPHNYYFLSDHEGNRLKLAEGYEVDMRLIEALVKELPWRLPIEFKNALTQCWNENQKGGGSRWRWLSNVLKDALTMTVVQSTTLSDSVLESVHQVLDYPHNEDRYALYGEHATRAYYIQSTLSYSGNIEDLISPHLLLVRYPKDQKHQPLVMLCLPEGSIQTYSSMEAVTQSRAKIVDALYAVDSITTQCYEIDGDLFDAEAALMLSKYLSNISKLKLPTSVGIEVLKATCSKITDASTFFTNAPATQADMLSRLQLKLPEWLAKATSADQAHYRSWSLALARAKKNAQGLSYLSGITDIHSFTVDSLKRQLQLDEQRLAPSSDSTNALTACEPDDIELTFMLVTGTFAPGSTNASGLTERVTMSLTELALKNLSGQPQGELIHIGHRQGLTLPTWFTAHYLTQWNGLIESVDIGKNYPEKLKFYLLDDASSRTEREKRFCGQLKWQLPLQALELYLKGEVGMTRSGARYVEALMQSQADDRLVDGQQIVIRTLALLSSSIAKPDIVSNMFIIEPLNSDVGPHVLYRPFYARSLLEFASRADLMNAIAQPGELQTSVLTWLSDLGRTIYDNGGFKEPHLVRFNPEDDFPVTAFEKPEPATLAVKGVSSDLIQHLRNGQLLPYLYQINALSLTHQADRDTVTNYESRWSIFLQGANLFFNIFVQPFLRGPVMLTVWFLQLIDALSRDIPALSSDEAVTRELAVVDLLQNLAMVLFQFQPDSSVSQPQLLAKSTPELRNTTTPRRITKAWPPQPSAAIKEGRVMMEGEWQKNVSQDLDFSFASGNSRLSPDLRKKFEQLAVHKPDPLPLPEQSGIRTGLYSIGDKWYVFIDEGFYPVQIDSDEIRVEGGPYLQSDGHGRWSVDLKLRLSGGAPSKQIAAMRLHKATRINELKAEYAEHLSQRKILNKKNMTEYSVLKAMKQDARRSDTEILEQTARLLVSMELQMSKEDELLASNSERIKLGIGLSVEEQINIMQLLVKNTLFCLGRTKEMRIQNNKLWEGYELLHKMQVKDGQDTTSFRRAIFRDRIKGMIKTGSQDIRLCERLERVRSELAALGERGIEAFESAVASQLTVKDTLLKSISVQLGYLSHLSTKIWDVDLEADIGRVIEALREQVHTQDQLNSLDIAPVERLDLLGSLVDNYGRALESLRSIQVVNSEGVEVESYQVILDVAEKLFKKAELQLAVELKPLSKAVAASTKPKPKLSDRPRQRIIKTRNKGRLIAELKVSEDGVSGEIAEVRSEQDDQLLSSYIRDGDSWRPVAIEPAVKPVKFRNTLTDIKTEAVKLNGMAATHIKRAEGLIKTARYPQEAEETLLHVADRLDKVALELEEASKKDTESWRQREDLELVGGMRARALDMRSKAHDLRVRLSLKLPPTHGSLQYLLEEQLVSITLNRKRQRLKRDFIDEYAIEDEDGKTIWCAHFHYKEANTAKADYDVAHLKLWSQRTSDYWSLKDKAKNQHEVVEVYHSQIGRRLAEQWFLPLTT